MQNSAILNTNSNRFLELCSFNTKLFYRVVGLGILELLSSILSKQTVWFWFFYLIRKFLCSPKIEGSRKSTKSIDVIVAQCLWLEWLYYSLTKILSLNVISSNFLLKHRSSLKQTSLQKSKCKEWHKSCNL